MKGAVAAEAAMTQTREKTSRIINILNKKRSCSPAINREEKKGQEDREGSDKKQFY